MATNPPTPQSATADAIGVGYHDLISITDEDLRLSGELRALLNLVRDKRSECEELKRELRHLDQNIQSLKNFKVLVNELLLQSFAVSEGAKDVETLIKSTMGNLGQVLAVWERIESSKEESQRLIAPSQEEEVDPIPFDDDSDITDEF